MKPCESVSCLKKYNYKKPHTCHVRAPTPLSLTPLRCCVLTCVLKILSFLDRFCSWTCSVIIKAWRDDKGRPHPERFVFSRWERRAWPFDGRAPMLELCVIA